MIATETRRPKRDSARRCETRKALMAKWRAEGLCYRCGQPPALDAKRCERCLARDRKSGRKLSAHRRASGKCQACGGRRDDNFAACSRCRARKDGGKRRVRHAAPCVDCGNVTWAKTGVCTNCQQTDVRSSFGARAIARLAPEKQEFAQWLIARQWPHIERCCWSERARAYAYRELVYDAIEYAKVVQDCEAEKADLDAPIAHGLTANKSIAWLAAESADPIQHGQVSR